MTREENLYSIENLIENKIEVHASSCPFCENELFGEMDSFDISQTASALLSLFEEGIHMNRDEFALDTKDLLKNNHDLSEWENSFGVDQTAPDLFLSIFEDGVHANRDEMIAKIKNLMKWTIEFFAYCDSCEEEYESWADNQVVRVDDHSIHKTSEALFDLFLELKHR